jgi:hypothetical protein
LGPEGGRSGRPAQAVMHHVTYSGNLPNEIDLFTSSEIGFAITGFAIFKILAEMPSLAYLLSVLDMGVKLLF